jgi:hypothetical protein
MVIHLISGPRNISTALMYSFASRPDTRVADEPFYASYLHRFPEVDHPGREEVLTAQPTQPQQVVSLLRQKAAAAKHLFVKNMGHHLIGVEPAFMLGFTNVFLIRHPEPLIASLAQIIPEPVLRDVALARQAELFHYLTAHTGSTPVVIDSETVLANPPRALERLCSALDMAYTPAMLSWPRGAIFDPVPWARWWYQNVMNSTGFEKQPTSTRPFPERLRPLLEEALPYYHSLKKHAITL